MDRVEEHLAAADERRELPRPVRQTLGEARPHHPRQLRRGDTEVSLLFASTYRRVDGSWKLAVHQQTPR